MLFDEAQVAAISASLARGSPTWVRLYGRSMMPTLAPGALLRFDPVRPEECEAGDVVLVRAGGFLAVHRWVGGTKDGWVLQGDAFERPDPPIGDPEVLGRAAGFPIARGALPLPRAAQRPLARALVRALPWLREASDRSRRLGRGVWRGIQRRASLRRLHARWIGRISIERFEARHLEEIRRLTLERSERPERALMRGWESLLLPRNAAFLSRARGRIVGHAIVREQRGETSIGICGLLWIDPLHRGLGIARSLMNASIAFAREEGYRELHADVRDGEDAMRLLLELGFARAPDLPRRNARRAMLRLEL
jgi:GNAT superfamily N-acetyltransferase